MLGLASSVVRLLDFTVLNLVHECMFRPTHYLQIIAQPRRRFDFAHAIVYDHVTPSYTRIKYFKYLPGYASNF